MSSVDNPQAYAIARRKMLETQLKARGITNKAVLDAMGRVPRHFFVDGALASQAYSDSSLPIGYGQTISQPYIVALMLEALEPKNSDKALEIGSGSAYQTAILALLVKEVYAIERLEPIYLKGIDNLSRLDLHNIHMKIADGTLGWPEKAPFDLIVVAAGGPKIPSPLLDQLALGGRMIAPVGSDKERQKLVLVRKTEEGYLQRKELGACRFVDLVGRHGW